MLLKTFEFFHTVNIQHQFNKQEKIFSASENRNFSWKIPKTEIKSQELNLYWSSHLKNCRLVNKNQLIIHKGKKKGFYFRYQTYNRQSDGDYFQFKYMYMNTLVGKMKVKIVRKKLTFPTPNSALFMVTLVNTLSWTDWLREISRGGWVSIQSLAAR